MSFTRYQNIADAVNPQDAVPLHQAQSIAATGISGLTPGSILFIGAGGTPIQDNSKFFFDDVNFRLGIGTNAPAFDLDLTHNFNGNASIVVTNVNASGAALASLAASNGTAGIAFGMEGTGRTGSGTTPNLGPSVGFVSTTVVGPNPTLYLGSHGIITMQTGATQAERLKIDASGNVSISSLSVGGVVHSAVTTGQLSVGTVNTTDITNNAVDNTKLTTMSTARFKGRITAGTGNPEDLTGTQATTLLDIFTNTVKGIVPGSGGGTTNFLRADGVWSSPGTGINALTGDVVGSGSGSVATTISAGVVTNTKLANMVNSTFKARITAGAGTPEDITGTQATTLLDIFTSSLKGLVPASGGGTSAFLRADGTWTAPTGAGAPLTDGDKGDITVSSTGAVWTIDPNVVSNTKLAPMATNTLKGNNTGITANAIDLTVTQVKTMLGLPTTSASSATTITAGAGLIGGGDLSANRTINVAANVDGSIIVNADDIQVGVINPNTSINDSSIQLTKLEPIGPSKILGNDGPATQSPFDISVIAPLTMVPGNGQLTFATGFTTGSVVFQGSSQIAQNNANFFWNDTLHRLAVGHNSPLTALDARDDSNSSTGATIRNQGTGPSATAQFVATNNPGGGIGIAIGVAGTGFSASVSRPGVIAGTPYIVPHFGSQNIYVGAPGTLIFATGSTETTRLQILSSGLINISSLSAGGVVQAASSTGQLSVDTLTSGRVTFGAASGGGLAQDAGLVWDNGNKFLGVGGSISSPGFDLDVAHTTNGVTAVAVENSSAGTLAVSEYLAVNNSGVIALFGTTGGSYTSVGATPNLGASTAFLRSQGGNPLYIGAVADITFQTGGTQAEVLRLLSTGEALVKNKLVGSTAIAGNLILQSTTNASRGSITSNDPFGVGRTPGTLGGLPMFAVAGNGTMNSSTNASLDYFVVNTGTISITGSTNITSPGNGFGYVVFQPPSLSTTVIIGAGGSTPAAATVCVTGAPTITGGGSFAGLIGSVGLWVKAAAKIDGDIRTDGNVVSGGSILATDFSTITGRSAGSFFVGTSPVWAINATVDSGPSNPKVGFFSTTPVTQPSVSGSRAGNAALASLLTQLTNLGLISNGTTA